MLYILKKTSKSHFWFIFYFLPFNLCIWFLTTYSMFCIQAFYLLLYSVQVWNSVHLVKKITADWGVKPLNSMNHPLVSVPLFSCLALCPPRPLHCPSLPSPVFQSAVPFVSLKSLKAWQHSLVLFTLCSVLSSPPLPLFLVLSVLGLGCNCLSREK